MKYIVRIILPFLLFSCNGDPKKDAEPFPKKYEGFYAGMSINAFEKIAYGSKFTILEERDSWTPNEDNQVENPGLTLFLDDVIITADYWKDQIAKITVEGKKNPEFRFELQEILDNFENEIEISNDKYGFYEDDLKTTITVPNGEMQLIHLVLNDSLFDEYNRIQKELDEKVQIEFQKKYQ
ncbi:MAG: hypothetical protein GQ574_19520 [Crocinitomix sp.]|nr:hypothetical protein [Crocinitomix sp.]